MTTARSGSSRELVSALRAWIGRLFPGAERGERLAWALEEGFGADDRAVTAEICREMEAVAHGFSRHLELQHDPDGTLVPDAEPPGWPAQDRREVELRAGSVGGVTRRPDGIAVLALDGLDTVHLAAPYLRAAFALVRGARGLVLDLRRNGGGDPGTVALVLDWLLGAEPTHVSDVIYRDRTREWWTTGRLGELALPPDTPVAVLVSERTYSSGEALAYHIQSRGRARLVGQRTPGAADHVTPVRVRPTCARWCRRRSSATRSRARTGRAPASSPTFRASRPTPSRWPSGRYEYISEPGVVSFSPVSRSVFRPDRICGQPP